jgi:hypothetical protein
MNTSEWLEAFGVEHTFQVKETEAFKRMVGHKEMRRANGMYFGDERLYVTSPDHIWGWDEVDGPCVEVTVVHPFTVVCPSLGPNWVFERSSGFAGFRCSQCAAWIYTGEWPECECTLKTTKPIYARSTPTD